MWLVVVPRFIFSPEFIGDLMKIPALVQGGRVQGANRDTTAEIFYSTQINKGNNLHQEIFNWKNGRLWTTLRLQYSLNIWGENVKQPNCV